MKLATQESDQWRMASDVKRFRVRAGTYRRASQVTRHNAGFTLAEVLAAMLFLAIVIPAALEALHVASLAGEVAARKGAAARVADGILNQAIVTTNWNLGSQNGTVTEGAEDFRWTLNNQSWPVDTTGAMRLLTADVTFLAQGHDYSVELSTLVNSQTQPLNAAGMQP